MRNYPEKQTAFSAQRWRVVIKRKGNYCHRLESLIPGPATEGGTSKHAPPRVVGAM